MKDIELICFNLKDIVTVLSDVLSELFPGFTLSSSEKKELLYKTPLEVLDNTYVFTCVMNLEHNGCSYCIVKKEAIIERYEHYNMVRKALLRKLHITGWPEAYSPEELQLKIAAAGKESFIQICKSYISVVRYGF